VLHIAAVGSRRCANTGEVRRQVLNTTLGTSKDAAVALGRRCAVCRGARWRLNTALQASGPSTNFRR